VSWHRSKLRQSFIERASCDDRQQRERKSDHALHRHAERVSSVGSRLAAPLLIARDGAEIGGLYDDAVEWARVARRERVLVSSHPEAASARVPGTKTWRGTEGKLADRGREASGGFATRCGDIVLSVCTLVERESCCLPGELQPE